MPEPVTLVGTSPTQVGAQSKVRVPAPVEPRPDPALSRAPSHPSPGGAGVAKRVVLLCALAALVPVLAVYDLLGAAWIFLRPRATPGAKDDLYLVAPYPPGERSGGSKAIQGLVETLGMGYRVTVVPLYALQPARGWLRDRLGDLLTAALPMATHCRPFAVSPGTVRAQLRTEAPVLVEFLSGAIFLVLGGRPRNRIVLREHESLLRRLSVERAAARGLERLLLAVKLPVCYLLTFNVYLKVDRIVALTPEDGEWARRHFPFFGRKITSIPVSIDLPEPSPEAPWRAPGGKDLVFLANFYHRPNVDALLWFLRECAPHLGQGFRLHLYGLDEPLRGLELDGGGVEVVRHGFVEDLDAELRDVGIAVAPVVSGGGVRMKNLYLASLRKAVVTTPLGNEGIGFRPGTEAIVCDDGREMAGRIEHLARHPDEVSALGERARERVRASFGHDAILARYRAEVFR